MNVCSYSGVAAFIVIASGRSLAFGETWYAKPTATESGNAAGWANARALNQRGVGGR